MVKSKGYRCAKWQIIDKNKGWTQKGQTRGWIFTCKFETFDVVWVIFKDSTLSSVSRPHLALKTKNMSTSKGPFTISWALFQQFLNFNEDFRWFKAQRNGYFALFDAAAAVTESSCCSQSSKYRNSGMQTAKILSSTKLERGRKGGWEGKKTPTAAVCVALAAAAFCCLNSLF